MPVHARRGRAQDRNELPATVTPPVHEEAPTGSFAAGYAWHHRAYELAGITTCVVLGAWALHRVVTSVTGRPALLAIVPVGLVVGLLLADWVSGFVHWMFDTWGSVDTPIVGQLAIRTFREHHVDQKAICGHDFIETNGHNMTLAVIPFGAVAAQSDTSSWLGALVATSLVSWGAFVSITSQIHKWAHMAEPPRPVALLQRAGIFLRAAHHDVHHAAPFDENYCITCGWLNGPLRAIGYFRGMERVITWVTGVRPRKDDLDVTGNALAGAGRAPAGASPLDGAAAWQVAARLQASIRGRCATPATSWRHVARNAGEALMLGPTSTRTAARATGGRGTPAARAGEHAFP